MLDRNILLYGSKDPLPERMPLRAGPLSLDFVDGDLRYIKLGEQEILRHVYVTVRDHNWGTVLPEFSNLKIDVVDDSFQITYDATSRAGDVDLFWQAMITGDTRGTITFTLDGVARSTFLRNRIGFCVLHPAACAGAPCEIEHVDGTTERAAFPISLTPDQPVQPFGEMRALAHEVIEGVWASVRFSGDVFEMEDQRNWTDASYKTFCPPLHMPIPGKVTAGTKISQSVTLSLRGDGAAIDVLGAPDEGSGSQPITFALGLSATASTLPCIGLSTGSHNQPTTERELTHLKRLHLHHLRVDLVLSDPKHMERLDRAIDEAEALGIPLEVALFVSANADDELTRFKTTLSRTNPPVWAWLVYPVKENLFGGSPIREAVEAARDHLSGYAATALLGAGTNTDFIFMQRNPPPTALMDLVTIALHPQAHTFDSASLVETLAMQALLVTSARRVADGLPVIVSPITLKPRFNPYAADAAAHPRPGELPPQVDVRQMSLFGAGWTVGSLKYIAQGGAHSVTYYETTGWRGVMETEAGSPLPDRFLAPPGSVFPMYHVLADAGEFSGGTVIPTTSSDGLRVDGLAMKKDGRIRVLLANLGPEPQQIVIENLAERVVLKHLNETNVEDAMRSPASFRTAEGEHLHTSAGRLQMDVLPFGLVRIDSE